MPDNGLPTQAKPKRLPARLCCEAAPKQRVAQAHEYCAYRQSILPGDRTIHFAPKTCRDRYVDRLHH